jgi:iron(III) transport system ATP-binding protein
VRSIALAEVSLAHGARTILDRVSFVVAPGERVALLGPSGSGKTSVLRLVAGLLAPDRGAVTLGDEVVSNEGRVIVPPERRRIGMVFQDLALWPHLTVYGNLEFGLRARRVPKAERRLRIRETLDRVELGAFRDAHPTRLSGGEQQRVALARALVLRPDVLLMDEPLTSVDEELNRELRSWIRRMHQELGFTLLYVTHRTQEAAEIAERILRLENGRVALAAGPGASASPRRSPDSEV